MNKYIRIYLIFLFYYAVNINVIEERVPKRTIPGINSVFKERNKERVQILFKGIET